MTYYGMYYFSYKIQKQIIIKNDKYLGFFKTEI